MKLGRRARIGMALLAAVAAVAVYFAFGRRVANHPDLPEYTAPRFEVRPGRDTPFELAAVPAVPVATKLVAFAFAMGNGDSEPSPVEAKVAISPDGTVRLAGRGRTLEGSREVRVVLGAAADFKRYEDALGAARAGTSDGQVRVLVVPIVRVAQ
jgi:hypothetical protein